VIGVTCQWHRKPISSPASGAWKSHRDGGVGPNSPARMGLPQRRLRQDRRTAGPRLPVGTGQGPFCEGGSAGAAASESASLEARIRQFSAGAWRGRGSGFRARRGASAGPLLGAAAVHCARLRAGARGSRRASRPEAVPGEITGPGGAEVTGRNDVSELEPGGAALETHQGGYLSRRGGGSSCLCSNDYREHHLCHAKPLCAEACSGAWARSERATGPDGGFRVEPDQRMQLPSAPASRRAGWTQMEPLDGDGWPTDMGDAAFVGGSGW
jgi:hypothetical protein